MFKAVDLYYFSPTGGTKKTAELFCKNISENVKYINLAECTDSIANPESELAVFAAPVFAGRLPVLAAEKLKTLNGQGKKVVTLAVFGNRDFDDALLEMNDIAEACGFQVAASAALVARHTIVPEVAKGRPDAQDEASIAEFARNLIAKLESGIQAPVQVKGNHPYKDLVKRSMPPVSTDACNLCGKCISVCPVEAIRKEENAISTDNTKCFLCMACVYACPEKARELPEALMVNMHKVLDPLVSVRNENVFYL